MKLFIEIIRSIILNLQILHTGLWAQKMTAAVKLATVPAIFITISEGLTRWYIVNSWFMIFVFVAIALDHILGSIVHAFIKRDFTFKMNAIGLLIKLAACITGYIIFIMIHEILKDAEFIASYFKIVIQLSVFIYPAGSALGNLSILTGGKFPPIGWMNKIAKFQENLNINEFKTKRDESSIDNS